MQRIFCTKRAAFWSPFFVDGVSRMNHNRFGLCWNVVVGMMPSQKQEVVGHGTGFLRCF